MFTSDAGLNCETGEGYDLVPGQDDDRRGMRVDIDLGLPPRRRDDNFGPGVDGFARHRRIDGGANSKRFGGGDVPAPTGPYVY